MRVIALRDFTLASETHAMGEMFDVDEMRGAAWKIAGVVREATPEEIEDADADDGDDNI